MACALTRQITVPQAFRRLRAAILRSCLARLRCLAMPPLLHLLRLRRPYQARATRIPAITVATTTLKNTGTSVHLQIEQSCRLYSATSASIPPYWAATILLHGTAFSRDGFLSPEARPNSENWLIWPPLGLPDLHARCMGLPNSCRVHPGRLSMQCSYPLNSTLPKMVHSCSLCACLSATWCILCFVQFLAFVFSLLLSGSGILPALLGQFGVVDRFLGKG